MVRLRDGPKERGRLVSTALQQKISIRVQFSNVSKLQYAASKLKHFASLEEGSFFLILDDRLEKPMGKLFFISFRFVEMCCPVSTIY